VGGLLLGALLAGPWLLRTVVRNEVKAAIAAAAPVLRNEVEAAVHLSLPPGRVKEETMQGLLEVFPRLTEDVETLEVRTRAALDDLEELHARLEWEKRVNDQASAVVAIAGTLVGVAGGFAAAWVVGDRTGWLPDTGQFERGAGIVVVCLVLAFLMIGPGLNRLIRKRFGTARRDDRPRPIDEPIARLPLQGGTRTPSRRRSPASYFRWRCWLLLPR
jgi:hypothetical protein